MVKQTTVSEEHHSCPQEISNEANATLILLSRWKKIWYRAKALKCL